MGMAMGRRSGKGGEGRKKQNRAGASVRPKRVPKMSEVLADVAEPLLDRLQLPENEEEYRIGLLLAAAVWNASTFETERQRRQALAEAKKVGDVRVPEDLATLCDRVYERARSRYPDETRAIAAADLVRESRSRYRINVASAGSWREIVEL